MNIDEAISLVKSALNHTRLSRVQELVFREAWEGITYVEIAERYNYSVKYIQIEGSQLFQSLSNVLGERVTKNNLQEVLHRYSEISQKPNRNNNFASYNDQSDFINLQDATNLFSNALKVSALTIQKEQRTAQYFREKLGNDIELDMILVHGGNFLMGSPDTERERRSNESPQHPVTVKSFFLGRYPVTQEQWRIVAETYDRVNIELNPDPSKFKGAIRPVEKVSWYEAQEFCDRLAKKTKRPYRLPTEAEWEYACRAGTTIPFYFGNTISTELANYDGNYTYANGVKGEDRNETTPVDHFDIANAWGLCDMHGNVFEWCQDHWHGNYECAPEDGSAWLTENSEESRRICRGGSWLNDPRYCRSAYRDDLNPDDRDVNLGFRVSCSAPATLQHPTDQS
jgi:formylglycine-generating enzyme required for sulfatase activity